MKGVTKSGRKARPWRADVSKNGVQINLGRFETEKEAEAAIVSFNDAGVETESIDHGEYNASNIIIRHDLEFPFELYERLCATYTSFTRAGIKRLLDAALTVDECWDTVERRFLREDKSVDVSSEYREAYAELADQRR